MSPKGTTSDAEDSEALTQGPRGDDDQGGGPERRKRGAQPGNQNARKHGLYSDKLSDAARAALTEAKALSDRDLSEEIAVLRVKIAQLLDEHPDRIDYLAQALSLLTRMVSAQAKLNPEDEASLIENIQGVLKSIGGPLVAGMGAALITRKAG